MNITFAPRGILQIDDARIIFRNFSGTSDKFTREGDRSFCLVIPDTETYDMLVNDTNKYGVGWNIKVKPPREEGETPRMHLKVKVKFTDFGPNVYLKTGEKINKLDEESISILDKISMTDVSLDIRPYDDEVQGKPFRAAYLHGMVVTQNVDRFAAMYENYEDEE